MLKIIRFRNIVTKCHLTRMYTQKISIGDIETDLQEAIEKMPRIKLSDQPPKVWQWIEKINKDGKLIKFTIQEIPKDRHEDVIQHMCTYVLSEEPMSYHLNVKDDPLFLQDINIIWRLILTQGIATVIFTDDPNGKKPVIAGVNAVGVRFKNQKDSISEYQFKSEKCKKIVEVSLNLPDIVYNHYGVDKYLCTAGLSLDPDYRGYELSKNILKIRNIIGSTYGIPATASVFTSVFAQKSAAKVGFEELSTINFSNLVDKDGNEYFPGIKYKMFKIMGKRLF